jgi:hypothetical protein
MVEVCPFSLNWILGENSADTAGFYKKFVKAVSLACLFKYVIDDDVFAIYTESMGEVCPFSLNWILGENSADTASFRIWGANLAEYMYSMNNFFDLSKIEKHFRRLQ